jgi:MraZ protein
MLIGQYTNKLTEKGRTALPAKFRRIIGSKAIIAKWYEGCLVLISAKDWSSHLERLKGKDNMLSQPVRNTDRFILGSAFEMEPDTQGRILIPKALREYAELADEVVFLGLGKRVEIWDKTAWQKKEKQIQKDAAEYIEQLQTKQ